MTKEFCDMCGNRFEPDDSIYRLGEKDHPSHPDYFKLEALFCSKCGAFEVYEDT
jgi:hypothetical protein